MDDNQSYPSTENEGNENENHSAEGETESTANPQPGEAQPQPQFQEEASSGTEGGGEPVAGQTLQGAEAEPPAMEEGLTPEEKEEEPAVEEEILPPVIEAEKPALQKEESSVARFFRRALQWIIIGLVLVATGAILLFIMVHQPVRQALDSTEAELQTIQEKYTQSENSLTVAQSELADAKTELQQSQEDLLRTTNQVKFLRVMSNINAARYALVIKEGATTRVALLDAQTDLKDILESVSSTDKELALLLDVRLERAINNLAGDPKVTETDLNTMIQDMNQLEGLLFPEE